MIAHSPFCNESVVISYGIVIANLITISDNQKFMTKKSQTKRNEQRINRDYAAHCLAVSLLNECYYRENQACNPADNPRNYADMLQHAPSHLPAVLAEKAAFVDYRPSFVGYCKAILVLLKTALIHKKRNRFIVIGW